MRPKAFVTLFGSIFPSKCLPFVHCHLPLTFTHSRGLSHHMTLPSAHAANSKWYGGGSGDMPSSQKMRIAGCVLRFTFCAWPLGVDNSSADAISIGVAIFAL
jgi:hypothetical protein